MDNERTRQNKITQSQEKTEINVAIMQTDIGYIKKTIEEVNKKFDLSTTMYVTRAEFWPVKTIVYGVAGMILIGVMNNNQRDPKWANIPVGFGEQTIGQIGCTISVIGDVLGLTPPEVNDGLKAVNGFSDGTTIGAGNLVVWAKITEVFPGTQIKRVWTYDNNDVLANIPNVIVEVPAIPIGGRGSHWVRYLGNEQLEDPWTGTVRPTSDFPNPTGYCVIIPKVVQSTEDMPDYLKQLFQEQNLDPNDEGAVRAFWQQALDAPGLKANLTSNAGKIDDLTSANNQQADIIGQLNKELKDCQQNTPTSPQNPSIPPVSVQSKDNSLLAWLGRFLGL